MNPTRPDISSEPAPACGPRNLDLLVGGQAVLEGIMMRGRKGWAVAVRKKDGSIVLDHGKISDWSKFLPPIKWPFFRGALVLIQSLALGIRALNFAAEHVEMDDEPAKAADGKAPSGTGMSKWAIAGTLATAVAFAVGLFVLMPLGVTAAVQKFAWPEMPNLAFNAIDGLVRVFAFVLYLVAISRIPEIGRVFQYHGAEHKVVWTYEEKGALTVDAAQQRSRLHPRCGTSFLFFVLIVSILCFALIPKESPLAIKALGRIVLMPVIAGIAYETIRWTGKRPEAPFVRTLVAPGLWLQNVTTREPSADQVEVALVALAVALRYDGEVVETVTVPGELPALAVAGAA